MKGTSIKIHECRVKQTHYKRRLLFKNIHFHIELMGRGIMYTRDGLPSPGNVVSSAVYTARGGQLAVLSRLLHVSHRIKKHT
jgi:hypothetical protein